LFLANPLHAADRVGAGEFITEPATLLSLGFEWLIDGDDNRNAEVSVFYRKKGEAEWKQGLSLFRLQREQVNSGVISYTAPNMFAGSIFDLEPGTDYECWFLLAMAWTANLKSSYQPVREPSRSRLKRTRLPRLPSGFHCLKADAGVYGYSGRVLHGFVLRR
jgi:hypothetical protein